MAHLFEGGQDMTLGKSEYRTLRLHPKDNVAVALSDLPSGVLVTVGGPEEPLAITIRDPIPFGHKFALRFIRKGEDVVKYGETIGRAVADIPAGAHVHVHNVEGIRGRGDRA